MAFFLLLRLNCLRVSQTGPRPTLGPTQQFSGGHKQRLSLGSFAVILHNPSVTMYYVFASLLKEAPAHESLRTTGLFALFLLYSEPPDML